MKEIKDLPEVDKVSLPNIGGIRPGVYILTLLILAAAIIIFLIGFLPGILHGGRFVSFDSEIDGVGLYVDNTYISGLPGQQFVESGEHTITYKKGGIVLSEQILEIDHPVFFTWLVRRNKVIEMNDFDLSSEDTVKLRSFDIQMSYNQSRVTTFTSVVNYIPYALQYAKDAIAYGWDADTVAVDLDTMSGFISSIEMVEDIQNAYDLIGIEEGSNFKTAKTLFDGSLMDDVGEFATDVSTASNISTSKSSLNFDGNSIDSILIPSNTFIMGDRQIYSYPKVSEAGISVENDDFYISTVPVSQYLYSLFVQDNPTWSKSNIESLIESNLVDQNYLKGIALSTQFPSYAPITNISYNAATAFCTWLSSKTDKNVIIPTETMWSSAALASDNYIHNTYSTTLTSMTPESNRPQLMLGGVWEFTSSNFLPYSRLIDESSVEENLKNLDVNCDVVVKGGSILNTSTTINSVGVMERDVCFDYLGFRIAYN